MTGELDPTRSIGIVVPTWNRAGATLSLVRAVLEGQTDPYFELVVVDDGSDDDTVDVLRSIEDDRFTIRSIPHGGVGAARNAGAATTSSAWIVFLDSDDEPDPDWLASFRAAMRSDVDIVSVGQRRRLSDGTELTVRPERLGSAFGGLDVLWQAGAFAIRRELFDDVGRYRPGLLFSENTDLGFRVARHAERHRVVTSIDPEPRYTVVVRPDRYDPAIQLESAQAMLATNLDRLQLERRLLANYEAIAGVAAHRLGDRPGAIAHLRRAVRARPIDLRHSLRLVRAAASS